MKSYSPLAIANEFLRHSGVMPHMKIQKLVYMVMGWSLAIYEESIVAGHAQAWDNGPVFPDLYQNIRHTSYFNVDGQLASLSDDHVFTDDIEPDHAKLIDAVWQRYGDMSASELSDATHKDGTPWTETYLTKGRNNRIPEALIKAHFKALGRAGREHRNEQ